MSRTRERLRRLATIDNGILLICLCIAAGVCVWLWVT